MYYTLSGQTIDMFLFEERTSGPLFIVYYFFRFKTAAIELLSSW